MTKRIHGRWKAACVLALLPAAGTAWAQEPEETWSQPPTTAWGEPAGTIWGQAASPVWRMDQPGYEPPPAPEVRHYNIPVGDGGLNLSAGVQGIYVDNVFLTHTGAKDDFVFVPQANVAAYFPVGLTNALELNLGISYYEYTKNSSLNTGVPIVNPNSELAFNLQTGDFLFRFSEAFSFEQDPVYDTGGEFFNIYDTGLFARYDNRVGVAGKWDLHQLVVSASYYHDNLWSDGSTFNYIDHASELGTASAMLQLSPRLFGGLEAGGSYNRFDNEPILDSWRARVGPGFRLNLSEFVRARLGGGYERIQYDSGEASSLGIDGENTWYAYAGLDHDINRFLSQSLDLVHDNQLGYNAGNLEESRFTYSLSWRLNRSLTLAPLASVGVYRESFDTPEAHLYNERFYYVLGGLSAFYQFDRHLGARLSYDYRLKDSGIEQYGYQQNRVTLEVLYAF